MVNSTGKTNSSLSLSGIIPPLVTPFDENGEIQFDLFRKEVSKMLRYGVGGISVGGSTGEGETLLDEELTELCRIAKEEVGNDFPIVGGIIADSTFQVIRKAKSLKSAGVNALMVTPVHYLFNSGDKGNYAFYKEIHEAIDLPIIVYNVVKWNIPTTELLINLLDSGIIFGVKQSGGDIHSLGDLLSKTRGKFPIYTAIDDMMLASFIMGAVGSICAINTLMPKTSIKLFNAVKEGDLSSALKLHETIFSFTNKVLKPDMPARIKFIMNKNGWKVGNARSPIITPVNEICSELNALSTELSRVEG